MQSTVSDQWYTTTTTLNSWKIQAKIIKIFKIVYTIDAGGWNFYDENSMSLYWQLIQSEKGVILESKQKVWEKEIPSDFD